MQSISSGLSMDPCATDDGYWTDAPEIVSDGQWSDMVLDMIVTQVCTPVKQSR